MGPVLQTFFPLLLRGFLVNFEIGVAVVVIGVLLGVPMALLRRKVGALRHPVNVTVRLLQAMPTYVAMFFILNWLPRDVTLFGWSIRGMTAVVLSLSIYLTAYVAEDANEAFAHLERNDRERALLFFPNFLRGFTVVLMSSGFGAAVGVSEAVSVTMRQAERLPALGDRVLLFAVAIAFFVAVVGPLNLLGRVLVRRLIGRRVQTRPPAKVRPYLDPAWGPDRRKVPR
jgi:His/Glu/Gln/Arg/opine family amino acid ABC transporter permease subunit